MKNYSSFYINHNYPNMQSFDNSQNDDGVQDPSFDDSYPEVASPIIRKKKSSSGKEKPVQKSWHDVSGEKTTATKKKFVFLAAHENKNREFSPAIAAVSKKDHDLPKWRLTQFKSKKLEEDAWRKKNAEAKHTRAKGCGI